MCGLCCKRRQLRAAPPAVAVGHGKMVMTLTRPVVVSIKVALVRYRTKIHFSNICTSGVVFLVNLLCSKDCTFCFTTYRETYRYSL